LGAGGTTTGRRLAPEEENVNKYGNSLLRTVGSEKVETLDSSMQTFLMVVRWQSSGSRKT
jgi:hypothetical protein